MNIMTDEMQGHTYKGLAMAAQELDQYELYAHVHVFTMRCIDPLRPGR